ncbi:MAG TPA: hypothetical protein VGM97_07230 [Steroidobacteraceae bacterium]|jgi:hypothetical protein
MNDDFMQSALRQPPPPFAAQLRARLRHLDARRASSPRRRHVLRAVACAASLLLAVGLVALPAVRAGAETFLDLFRVVNFVAVPVPTQRIATLQQGLDLPRMLGEQMHLVQAPGAPQSVATPEQAGALSGIAVHPPTWLPEGLARQKIEVQGEWRWTIAASTQKLQQILDSLGINDLALPPGLDGQTATIHVYPSVHISYGAQAAHVQFIQARQPQAVMPRGTDLPLLAEIGLRVLGFEPNEARRFANTIDWRTTLLVPVPVSVANFHEVDLGGGKGLLIETAPTSGPPVAQLLWSADGSVFALIGDVRPEELFEMARSAQ